MQMRIHRAKPQRQILNPCLQIDRHRANRVHADLAKCGYDVRPREIGGVTFGRVICRGRVK